MEKEVMPEVKKGEDRSAYVQRCIPIRRKEHPDEPRKQSIRVCFEMWRKRHKK